MSFVSKRFKDKNDYPIREGIYRDHPLSIYFLRYGGDKNEEEDPTQWTIERHVSNGRNVFSQVTEENVSDLLDFGGLNLICQYEKELKELLAQITMWKERLD